ncbi:hypothetical protein [Sporosarcina limicola]|uniref:Lipoprotein n=1 Tax=Sporosarcina limicola TaxID=34101 RepID=A0A927MLB7_9BACL|nr:hypothetical protein [Sporosarcina limicola]MBE1553644.1 hypothetical protein [Sporosarcina limicola]
MKSKWSLLYTAIAAALLLSACGTETGKDSPDNSTSGSKVAVAEPEKNGDVEEEEEEEEKEAIVPEKAEVAEIDKTGAIDKSIDGQLMNEAKLTKSDEQGYAMSVLPAYKLASEEPGRDSLAAVENESVFMRIETMTNEEGTYDYLVENMVDVLEASSNGRTPVELTEEASTPTGEGIKNVKVLSVQAESSTVTGIVFERGDILVRLTIFDSPKEEHFESFLRMGETIIKN